ncbi:MAG: histidinol dehydrogenase, partial [Actinobacteria bacterium]
RRPAVTAEVLEQARDIVEQVRSDGEPALRRLAERFGDTHEGTPIVIDRDELASSLNRIDDATRDLLRRTAGRIETFAGSQLETLRPLDTEVPGGRAGHELKPVRSVGAYAPGGRHPLPSSVLMTVVPARVAGVREVWIASPRPSAVTLAAASIAGADGLLAVGGAQAIAALAFGTVSPAVDMIVGPGNAWVTAAKKHLFGEVGIDGLAGPSEIVVIADEQSDAGVVAADLLAQAEHDTMAEPILITTHEPLIGQVEAQLARQLQDLATSNVASAALQRGFMVLVASRDEAASLADHLAPEHLALHVDQPDALAADIDSYGSLFIGAQAAEALADYGIGPNHVLPTGGGARFQSGLSVMTYIRTPTWLRIDDAVTAKDAAHLARLEGLDAHARAALARAEAP